MGVVDGAEPARVVIGVGDIVVVSGDEGGVEGEDFPWGTGLPLLRDV